MTQVVFILPASGGGGGAHSVMQEAEAMWRLGVSVTIATNPDNAPRLRRTYRDLPTIHRHIVPFGSPEELGEIINKADAVIATTNQSVHTLARALTTVKLPDTTRLAYYIQDYEPLFYAKDSDEWLTAYTSYEAIPNLVCFAKTRWLQEVVQNNHGIQVHKVTASIDHTVYYPNLEARLRPPSDRLTIAAMIRPATPRRAPRRTVRILNRLAHDLGPHAVCAAFGCDTEELNRHSLRLYGIHHLGVLRRDEVADLLRSTDIFLDLSDFQAFGRTAIEAMSCGAVSVVPAHGGAYEFAEHGKNSFIVDTRDDAQILDTVTAFMKASPVERQSMMFAAIETGFRYSPERAALSELSVLLGPS